MRKCTQQQQQSVVVNSAAAGLQDDGPEQPGGVISRAAESQPEGMGEPPASAIAMSREAANKQQQLLSAALAAVTDLAMCADAPAADAAFVVAWSCIAALLKGTAASGSAAASVKQDLQSLYLAVAAGEAADKTVLQQLMGQLRKLATGSSNVAGLAAGRGEPATMPLALPAAAVTGMSDENAVPVCMDAELTEPPTGLVNSSSSSKRAAAGGSSSSSKRLKATAAESRAPPDWADSRVGRWVDEEYYVQLGDVVIMQVDESCDSDPCTFFVHRNSTSSGSSSSNGGSFVGSAAARAWVFRVESFGGTGGVDSSMMARFYYNTQRDLQQPLLFKRKSERLLLGKVQGIVHTLMPSRVKEVLQQLDAQLVEEVTEALWQKADVE